MHTRTHSMAQQYSYGYGYGYGYGTPNPYMAAQMPVATPQMPVATPQMPVAAVVTQAPTPAVGYSPYQTQVVPAASRPPLPGELVVVYNVAHAFSPRKLTILGPPKIAIYCRELLN